MATKLYGGIGHTYLLYSNDIIKTVCRLRFFIRCPVIESFVSFMLFARFTYKHIDNDTKQKNRRTLIWLESFSMPYKITSPLCSSV